MIEIQPWPPAEAVLVVEGVVLGPPKTAGSKVSGAVMRFDKKLGRKVPVYKDGHVLVSTKEDDKSGAKKGWRSDVRDAVLEAFAGNAMLLGPLVVELTTVRIRPKGHYGTGKNERLLKPSAPRFPTAKSGEHSGDAGKLARAFEDALNTIVWEDDALNVDLRSRKVWEDRFENDGARMEFRIWALPEFAAELAVPDGQATLAVA